MIKTSREPTLWCSHQRVKVLPCRQGHALVQLGCTSFGPERLGYRVLAAILVTPLAKWTSCHFQIITVQSTVIRGWGAAHNDSTVGHAFMFPQNSSLHNWLKRVWKTICALTFYQQDAQHYYLHCMSTLGGKGQIRVLLTSTEAWMVLYDFRNVIDYASNDHSYLIGISPLRINVMV